MKPAFTVTEKVITVLNACPEQWENLQPHPISKQKVILKMIYTQTQYVYLNAVNNKSDKQWHITALVDKNSVLFKVDTGAEVTALSDVTFQSFTNPDHNFRNQLRYSRSMDPMVHPLMCLVKLQ